MLEFKSIELTKDCVVQSRRNFLQYKELSIPLGKIDNIGCDSVVIKPVFLFGIILFLTGIASLFVESTFLGQAHTVLFSGGIFRAIVGIFVVLISLLYRIETVTIMSGTSMSIGEHGEGSIQFAHELEEIIKSRKLSKSEKANEIKDEEEQLEKIFVKPV